MKHIFSILFFSIGIVSYAQTYTLEELQKKFKPENYSEKIVLEFQKSIANFEEKPDLYEYIPGEVIAWSFMDGGLLLSSVFLIKSDSIKEVEAIPKDDAFLSKLNSYVPEQSRFIYQRKLWTLPSIKEKLTDNSYLVKVNVTSYNPRPYEPSPDILTYTLEYTTHDFINFHLVRLKNVRSEGWIIVDK